ncbi:hypothetical protein BB561_003046 [Smittium simulii]|uniref:Uncharacterized protein n=1 Tax=Smittium simulii TaxID=133385 RepID=A0A2T9YN96_9FUNG|nr:hypothetical protein BB561_003046 [Smittium simulii]
MKNNPNFSNNFSETYPNFQPNSSLPPINPKTLTSSFPNLHPQKNNFRTHHPQSRTSVSGTDRKYSSCFPVHDLSNYILNPSDNASHHITESFVPKTIQGMLFDNDLSLSLNLHRNTCSLICKDNAASSLANSTHYSVSSGSRASWNFFNDEDSDLSESSSIYSYFSEYSSNILKSAQNSYKKKLNSVDANFPNHFLHLEAPSTSLYSHVRSASFTNQKPIKTSKHFRNYSSLCSNYSLEHSNNNKHSLFTDCAAYPNSVFDAQHNDNTISYTHPHENQLEPLKNSYYTDCNNKNVFSLQHETQPPIDSQSFNKFNYNNCPADFKSHLNNNHCQTTSININSLQDQVFKSIQNHNFSNVKYSDNNNIDLDLLHNNTNCDPDINDHQDFFSEHLDKTAFPKSVYNQNLSNTPKSLPYINSENLSPTFTFFDRSDIRNHSYKDPIFDLYSSPPSSSFIPTKGILYFSLFFANMSTSVASPLLTAYTIDKLVDNVLYLLIKKLKKNTAARKLSASLSLFGASVIFNLLANYLNRLLYLATLKQLAESKNPRSQSESFFSLDISLFLSKNIQKISCAALFGYLISFKFSKKYLAGLTLYHIFSTLLIDFSFFNPIIFPAADSLNHIQAELLDADKEQIMYEKQFINGSGLNNTANSSVYYSKMPFLNFSNYLSNQPTSIRANFSYLLSKLNIELSHDLDLKKIESSIFFSIESLEYLQNSMYFIFSVLLPQYHTLKLIAGSSNSSTKSSKETSSISDILKSSLYVLSYSSSLSPVISDILGIIFHSKNS